MDRERILAKIDELNQYIAELEAIMPQNFEEYVESIEERRACERLLQIAIECILDICALLVKELKLGLPSREEDLFTKILKKGIITEEMERKLRGMKGFRNILVHRYAEVDDRLVFKNLSKINDFREFREQVLEFLRKYESKQ